MSHNPNTVKSQDELNEGGRKSDVLLSTIDKIADLEEWKKDMQAKYGNKSAELEKTKKQLDIAKIALKEIEKSGTDTEIKTITTLCVNNFLLAHKALKEIEELNEIHKQE